MTTDFCGRDVPEVQKIFRDLAYVLTETILPSCCPARHICIYLTSPITVVLKKVIIPQSILFFHC